MAEATDYTFAWTAPASGGLGSIMLRQAPKDRLTSATFWNAVGERINRMIAAEDHGKVIRIFRDRCLPDTVTIDETRIATAGSVIAERSEWLHDRVQFPRDGVPSLELVHHPETLEYLRSGEDGLEDFIGLLYLDPGWS